MVGFLSAYVQILIWYLNMTFSCNLSTIWFIWEILGHHLVYLEILRHILEGGTAAASSATFFINMEIYI